MHIISMILRACVPHDRPAPTIAAPSELVQNNNDIVDLAEYERMRAEIDNRMKIANQLVAANVTAMAAGFATYDHFKGITLGLAIVSSVLWLLWLDHATQIYKIAAYIELWIAPRLRRRAPGSLAWEAFLRELDTGGSAARRALRVTKPLNLSIPPTSTMEFSVGILFGASALLLTAMYWFTQYVTPVTSLRDRIVAEAAGAIPIALLAFAIARQRRFQAMTQVISGAILLREPEMSDESRGPEPPSTRA